MVRALGRTNLVSPGLRDITSCGGSSKDEAWRGRGREDHCNSAGENITRSSLDRAGASRRNRIRGDELSKVIHRDMYTSCAVTDSERGRIMVATEDIAPGTVICDATLFACCALEETKKKVCATCLKISEEGRYELKCAACGKSWFCSRECAADAAVVGEAGACPTRTWSTVPHGYVCEALQQLARGGKLDKQLVSLLRYCGLTAPVRCCPGSHRLTCASASLICVLVVRPG